MGCLLLGLIVAGHWDCVDSVDIVIWAMVIAGSSEVIPYEKNSTETELLWKATVMLVKSMCANLRHFLL